MSSKATWSIDHKYLWSAAETLKIATFNANSIRTRLETILSWLEKQNPDILCIQETKVTDDLFPSQRFEEAGFSVTFKGQKSYNGVAIISREKPSTIRFGFDDGGEPDQTRLLYARFGPLHVVNTYVPQGRDIQNEMFQYKLDWFRRLQEYFDRHFTPRMKVVWLGDLNIAPEAMDIHNAERQKNHVCYHEDVRNAFQRTKAWGFEDVFRKHHPEAGQYTFFDYRTPGAARRGLGWRIDHILASGPLTRMSTDSYIDLEPRLQERPSDHTFLVAEFDVP